MNIEDPKKSEKPRRRALLFQAAKNLNGGRMALDHHREDWNVRKSQGGKIMDTEDVNRYCCQGCERTS